MDPILLSRFNISLPSLRTRHVSSCGTLQQHENVHSATVSRILTFIFYCYKLINCDSFLFPLYTITAFQLKILWLMVWRSANSLVSINEVNLRRAQLVLGWLTVSRVQLLVRENLSQYITSHPGQLSLAIPP